MPTHIVKCTQCGTDLDVSSFAPGQIVACPCGAQLTVPPRPLQATQPPPPASQVGAQPPPPQAGAYPTPPNVPPMGPPAPPYQQARATCKEANLALIFGIISIFCFSIILGPIAIALGSKAKKILATNPHLAGSGKATAGLVIGIITTILGAIWLIVLIASLASQ